MNVPAGPQSEVIRLLPPERRATLTLGVVMALRMFGLFMLLPVLALYADEMPGGTPLLAGLAVSIYGIAQALLQIPVGLISDRIGRKRVIIIGLAIFAAGSLVAATSDSISGLLVGRLLQGAGVISAAATALLADQTRSLVRTRAMAVLGILIGLSFMIALATGQALANSVGVKGLFYLGAVFAVVGMLATLSVPGGWAAPGKVSRGDFVACLCNRQLWPLHLGVFLLHAMLTATFVAVPYLLRDQFGVDAGNHAGVYLLGMALSLVATIPLVLAIERFSQPLLVFVFGIALLAAGQLVMAFAGSVATVTLALAIFFGGFNFLEARLPARVSTLAGKESRGAALGMFATGQFFGAFVGGALGGVLISVSGPVAVFRGSALAAIAWVAVVVATIGVLAWSTRRQA